GLAREVVVDRRRPDPDPVGHLAERGGVEAALRELLFGGVEDALGGAMGDRVEDKRAGPIVLVDNHARNHLSIRSSKRFPEVRWPRTEARARPLRSPRARSPTGTPRPTWWSWGSAPRARARRSRPRAPGRRCACSNARAAAAAPPPRRTG